MESNRLVLNHVYKSIIAYPELVNPGQISGKGLGIILSKCSENHSILLIMRLATGLSSLPRSSNAFSVHSTLCKPFQRLRVGYFLGRIF